MPLPLFHIQPRSETFLTVRYPYYEQKKFLASGRRENRIGGVILVLSSSVQEAEEIMKNDPFYIHDVADYDFMWFEPSKSLEEIKEFV